MELTQEYVLSLFTCRGGNLFWKIHKGSRAHIGDLAGSINSRKYRIITIDYTIYYAHRLIYLYYHGFIPEFLDHVDGNTLNNDISNLRDATLPQNQWNQKKTKSYGGKQTSSIYKGVYRNKQREKWHVKIQIKGTRKHIGYYDSEIEAAKAYNTAAIKYFGEYAWLNIIDEDA